MITEHDSKLPIASGFCKCAACGQYFVSERPFNIHRVGPPLDRRCVPVEALLSKGFYLQDFQSGEYWAGGKT